MSHQTDRLLEIMARLRDPQTGCEWDTAQNFATIAPYTIEEAYEVADAIERADILASHQRVVSAAQSKVDAAKSLLQQ